MTTPTVRSATTDCTAMIAVARPVSGMVSVGLNAVELVRERYW
jgi:hypothetical protein